MKRPILLVLTLFIVQIILCIYGNRIFQKEANPFAIMAITAAFAYYCFQILSNQPHQERSKSKSYLPWVYVFIAMAGLFTAYEEVRKLWVKYPDPSKISDVLPQLNALCVRFFTGEYPYAPVKLPTHEPFPIYMPLHWAPIQISYALGIDIRWSAMLILIVAVGIAAYFLSKAHINTSPTQTIAATLLFALPIWAYVIWAPIELSVSLEGIVAAWYILLATGLATKNLYLITIGIIGGVLSRYTLLFWLPLFAILLWLNAPRKYSYWVWGLTLSAFTLLFVLPFWMKDPELVSKVFSYYHVGIERTWLHPDEYTFLDGLSLNIHLRHWLPGNPEDNLKYCNYPQIIFQLILSGLGIYFYQKRWKDKIDIYSFSLIALAIMPLYFYNLSPMLFKYYMLMPLSVSAVLCWKTIACVNIESGNRF
ncbi:MAG: hypothetical protein WCR52_18315 [Bacteroidota bacterium]